MGVDEKWITEPIPEKEKKALAHSLNEMCYFFYNRAWNHQQAEIDRLKEEIREAARLIEGIGCSACLDKKTALQMHEWVARNKPEKVSNRFSIFAADWRASHEK